MSSRPGVWLADLSWPEAKARIDDGCLVVVPIGAQSKEHGHHLPLSTDFLLARELSERIMDELPVVVAPIVSFGYFPAFVRYPGSQHLRSDTFISLLKDILLKFAVDGVRHLAVVNTGVSTEAPLRIAVRDVFEATGLRVSTADIRTLGQATDGLLEQRMGGHGDEAETSMILAIEPDRVRMDLAEQDYGGRVDAPDSVFYRPSVFEPGEDAGVDYSKTGVFGDPSLATAEKGRAILDEMARELIDGLRLEHPTACR